MRLLEDDLRIPIEESVSGFLEKTWKITDSRDMKEFACHPCALLSNNEFGVFAKYDETDYAFEQFEIELSRLQYLKEIAGVNIPTPIGIIKTERGTLLILAALREIKKQERNWKEIAKLLAKIHRVTSDHYGFLTNGYWGPYPLDNTPSNNWIEFYTNQRLIPYYKLALTSGNLPSKVASQTENIINRFSSLCGPITKPSLLHGDAQQNNFISTNDGTFVIDPAVYYGNPEIDLATIDSWQFVPEYFFDCYKEENILEPDFKERRELWRIANYLGAVATPEGVEYLPKLLNSLNKYL